MNETAKTAVISGGAGGLGLALAAGLHARGWYTVLLDLRIEGLRETDQQIAIQCDLTDPVQLQQVTTRVLDMRPSIDLVIYNAGITQIGSFEEMSPGAHRKVFEVNYFAAVELARMFLSALRRAKGIHLAITSVAGFSPLINRTAYAASKHAMDGFFKSLRSEEARFGVRTLIAAPSFVATNPGNAERQNDGTARPGSATDGIDYMSPAQAADVILRAMERGKPMIPVGRMAVLAWWINGLSPRLFQRLMERQIKDD